MNETGLLQVSSGGNVRLLVSKKLNATCPAISRESLQDLKTLGRSPDLRFWTGSCFPAVYASESTVYSGAAVRDSHPLPFSIPNGITHDLCGANTSIVILRWSNQVVQNAARFVVVTTRDAIRDRSHSEDCVLVSGVITRMSILDRQMSTRNIPRLVIAGASSGVGKTTIVAGLCRALRHRNLRVAVFKVGPDYLDPTYHAMAAGTSSHTLDGWMMGKEAVLSTFRTATQDKDIALIEGVMGLFDGASPRSEEGSTAEVAKWLEAPVLAVIDSSGMARTIAAVAHGLATFDPHLWLAGILCNRIGSKGHLEILRQASRDVPVLGGLPEETTLSFPERHLGLHSANHSGMKDSMFAEWGKLVAEWFDLDRILGVASSARDLKDVRDSHQQLKSENVETRCRIGVARDGAFHFYYEDNIQRLQDLGATLVWFSPISDAHLPAVDGLYFGGGYPELHAAALYRNQSLQEEIRRFAKAGWPIYAECGGLMYLSSAIRALDGERYPMVGLIPGEAAMRDRLQALGYVEIETTSPSILGPAGLRFRGHQFRYSELQDLPEALERVYQIRRQRAGDTVREGYRSANVLASYVHAHWASNPSVAAGFVHSCAEAGRSR